VYPGIIRYADASIHVGDDLYDQAVLPSVHLQRAGAPDEVAKVIVFLCSDDASYITGTTITPDGGCTLTVP
jgi:NAD(P)-dependent dehydrogenase (short-subunit alcohol dehydrogenase family)